MNRTQSALDYDRVAAAIRYLDDHAPHQPTVAEVAAHVGLSRGHFQRTFKRWAGTSPKRFLQYLTAVDARRRLREQSVLDAALGTGLSSPGRLHDLMVTLDAMTPGEVGRGGDGLVIRAGRHATPLGDVVVGLSDRGVCLLQFVDQDARPAAERVAARWPRATIVDDPDATWSAIGPAFDGSSVPVNLHVQGTNLQLKVWEALLSVPSGATVTYQEVADAAGRPQAVRAVASAVARNPVAYLIPCHRVIRSTGHLGGYAWGLQRKRLLLAREAARRHVMS